jgi:pantoate kinase
MVQASAFAPGHLTGFFQICDEPEDPQRKGSRGAGFSITRGVLTTVRSEEARNGSLSIRINGAPTNTAVVSENVVAKMTRGLHKPRDISVEHEASIPIGAGFGASGGGALSLALALNEALELKLTRTEAARVAHVAEIECRTGLGTVLAELNGGFGVTAKPGGPGIGETVRFPHASGLRAVSLHFGPISTRKALSDEGLRRRINELGGRYVDELQGSPSVDAFLKLSRSFAEHVGLITPRIRSVLEKTDEEGFTFSMAMFGETVFSLAESEVAEELASLLRVEAPGHEVSIDGIDDRGAQLF